ncbi:MAG TPA: ECF-type sigma factor [Gemmatimonadaceae bacterium]|nr:ECF-type sigma factor [Gemmatimonadaceae bacterium]
MTQLLERAVAGDRPALDQVFERVYPELRRLAHQVRGGRGGDTLATTALAHEAYLKLVSGRPVTWQGRAHFFAVAARAMRQILVDAARARLADKRGAGEWIVSLDDATVPAPVRAAELIALDEALSRLAAAAPRRALVVEHRYFAGLTTEETAGVLRISTATVERDWRAARAWLAAELSEAVP